MSRKRAAVGVFNGNWKNRWRRDISERADFICEKNKLDFGDALCHLKAADPDWEAWFDNDENIPPVIYWSRSDEVKSLCDRMKKRIEDVKTDRSLPELRVY